MSYFAPYIDDSGIHMPTYEDRLQQLLADYQSIFGSGAELTPASPDYQLLSVLAKALDDTAALTLQAYNSRNPAYASGQALDLLLPQYGLTRLEGESDASARNRITAGLASRGNSVVEAIEAEIRLIPSVSHVLVRVNDTDAAVDSIPAHTIAAVVDAGSANAIASAIFRKKAPGIGTYGTLSRQVTDDHGAAHTISFSRPTTTSIFFSISLTTYAGFSESAVKSAMNAALLNHVNKVMEIGEDLNVPQLYGLLYQAAAEYATTFSITDLVLSYAGGTCRTKLTAAWNQKWYLSGEGSITYVI